MRPLLICILIYLLCQLNEYGNKREENIIILNDSFSKTIQRKIDILCLLNARSTKIIHGLHTMWPLEKEQKHNNDMDYKLSIDAVFPS